MLYKSGKKEINWTVSSLVLKKNTLKKLNKKRNWEKKDEAKKVPDAERLLWAQQEIFELLFISACSATYFTFPRQEERVQLEEACHRLKTQWWVRRGQAQL